MKQPTENAPRQAAKADDHALSDPPFFAMFDQGTLTAHWECYLGNDAGHVSDKFSYEEDTNNGHRKFGAIDLGKPFMHFQAQDLHVSTPVLYDVGFVTRRASGSPSQRVWEIHQRYPSADAQIGVKLPYFDNPAHFHITDDGKVMLQLSRGTSIETMGSGYDSAILKAHLQKQNGIRLPDTQRPTGVLKGDVVGQFMDGGSALLFTAAESSKPADYKGNAEPVPFAIYFSDTAFPEVKQNKPPQDMNCAVSLFVPEETVAFLGGAYYPESGHYGAQFGMASASNLPGAGALAGAKPSITPLMRQLEPGDEKQALTLEPSNASAQWDFFGEHVGELKNENGARFYYPPPPLTPASTLEENNKTNVPAALKARLEYPLFADVINATAGGQKATATFLTQYAPETHFFKASLVSGKVRLALWYTRFGSTTPVEVTPANTEWVRIAGNGNVDSNGVFTPAPSNPDPYTVLLAKDKDDEGKYYYWAYIVVPLPILEPAKVLELING